MSVTDTKEDDIDIPTACLFAIGAVGHKNITVSEKYMMISVLHPIVNPNLFSVEELDEELKKIDFLTFDWKSLPREVFIDIMNSFSYGRIAYLCGYFKVHIKPLHKNYKMEMISNLWKKLSK